MQTITKEYKVYEFKELSREAKDKAIEEWYEHEDYPFLEENLNELLIEKLKEHEATITDPKVFYSLSYSQGDGAMFEGYVLWRGNGFSVRQAGHYYHYNSKTIECDDDNLPDNGIETFNEQVYKPVCHALTKAGYAEIEYRMNDDEFQEHCEANDYQFLENGKMFN